MSAISIGRVIKRFKFEELESFVLPYFPEISWKQLRTKLIKGHESFTTNHAIKLILDKIKSNKLSKEELDKRLFTLEAVDISIHYIKKVWHCHELRGNKTVNITDLDEIESNIKLSFDQIHMEMDVCALENNGIIFLSIRNVSKKRRVKRITPIHFAIFSNEKYLFSCGRSVIKDVLLAVADGMGYTSCKPMKLNGKDIPSLLKLLHLKTKELPYLDPVEFKKIQPVERHWGLDLTQYKQRKKYGEQFLGDDPPKFECLQVKSTDTCWRDPELTNISENEEINFKWQFCSQSVAKLMNELISRKIIVTPLPAYVANILSLGKTELSIKKQNQDTVESTQQV